MGVAESQKKNTFGKWDRIFCKPWPGSCTIFWWCFVAIIDWFSMLIQRSTLDQATTTVWSPPARSQSKATMARMHVDSCRQNETKSRRNFFPQQSLDTQYCMVFQFEYFGFVLSPTMCFFCFCPSLLFSRRRWFLGAGLFYWAASRHRLLLFWPVSRCVFGREGVSWEATARHSWAAVGEELAEGWKISVKVVVGGKVFKQKTVLILASLQDVGWQATCWHGGARVWEEVAERWRSPSRLWWGEKSPNNKINLNVDIKSANKIKNKNKDKTWWAALG